MNAAGKVIQGEVRGEGDVIVESGSGGKSRWPSKKRAGVLVTFTLDTGTLVLNTRRTYTNLCI